MAKYNIVPNTNYNSTSIFKTFELQKIEKIIWYKQVGDFLNAGDILCEIHYDDCIFEMECTGGDYLLYQNTNTEISFSNILSIYGEKEETIESVFEKHEQDLKHYDSSNDPIFRKVFQIENTFCECFEGNLID